MNSKLDVYAGIGILVLTAVALRGLKELSGHCKELDVMGHLIPREGEACSCLHDRRVLVRCWSTEWHEKLDDRIKERRLDRLFV